MSECLVLGVVDGDSVVLLKPISKVKKMVLGLLKLHYIPKKYSIHQNFICTIPKRSKICVIGKINNFPFTNLMLFLTELLILITQYFPLKYNHSVRDCLCIRIGLL